MKKNNKGFTLAELLIVVAIIAVLVAIFIPIFTSQLEKAREATDAANIRSQYAEVMSEAITSGGDVSGKSLYGAVQLKQKKDGWQTSNLKENLEGMYAKVKGGGPKAGGTAWVEYISSSESVILHYEGGSSSGSSSDSGSGSGGTDSGSTSGGGSSGGSGDNTGGSTSGGGTLIEGGDSDTTSTDPADAYQNVEKLAKEWPAKGSSAVSVKRGEIYIHNNVLYISASTRIWDINDKWYTTPNSQSGDFVRINTKKAQTVADLKKPYMGSDKEELTNLSIGDLYQDTNNNYYVYKGGSPNNALPSPSDGNWIFVLKE